MSPASTNILKVTRELDLVGFPDLSKATGSQIPLLAPSRDVFVIILGWDLLHTLGIWSFVPITMKQITNFTK
jgi:hypothetical protein